MGEIEANETVGCRVFITSVFTCSTSHGVDKEDNERIC